MSHKSADIEQLPYLAFVSLTTLDGERWYMAEYPDLPGCVSDGATPDEALQNLEEARDLYIQSLLDEGIDVPEPYSAFVTTEATDTEIVSGHAPLPRTVLRIDATADPIREAALSGKVGANFARMREPRPSFAT